MDRIVKSINDACDVYALIRDDKDLQKSVLTAVEIMTDALKNGKKVLFCGNGGSAADAQHLAAELTGRFLFDRDPLPAIALHANTSFLTAVANDYSYNEVFARMVRATGVSGDVLFGISTSGNSGNVVRAIEDAQKLSMKTIGMTGNKPCKMAEMCDVQLAIPSRETPRIQEGHILIGHIVCQLIEENIFNA